MIDVAAGLALAGNVAFTGSFAVFRTGRAYDQIRNTVAYSNLNVKIAPTHMPVFRLVLIVVLTKCSRIFPLCEVFLICGFLFPLTIPRRVLRLKLAAKTPGPAYIRMGRAAVPAVYSADVELEEGKAYVLREGSDATIIACGVEIAEANKAAVQLAEEGISVEVTDAFSIKPLDSETILASLSKTGCGVVAEEHSVYGGLGSAVSEPLRTESSCTLSELVRCALILLASQANLEN